MARDDVAAVAAVVLQDPAAHANATYELTGPEALTFAEMAEIVSKVTGREVTYYNETLDEAYAGRGVGVDLHRGRKRRAATRQ